MSNFFVFDTNSLISIEVLFREKLDRYFADNNERWLILNKIKFNTSLYFPDISLKACRDPKDNKFLELAMSANASCIITGDKDLLVLHP